MKKFLCTIFAALVLCVGIASAQKHNVLEATTPLDNWFIGGNVGAIAPQNHAFDFSNHGVQPYRFEMGLELGKWFTPIIGASISDEVTVNTTPSHTAFDENDLMGNLHINLSNLFCGYKGSPRWLEIELIPSLGWKHYYGQPLVKYASNDWLTYYYKDINTLDVGLQHCNYVSYRAAMAFDFNLSDAWQLNVIPAINYFNRFRAHTGRFDVRVGLTYKIKGGNSNSHNFVIGEYYTSATYNNLLRNYKQANDENKVLTKALKDCQNSEPKTVEKVVRITETDDIVIGFKRGSTDLTAYAPVLKKVAEKIILTNKNVVITGYASFDGNPSVNSTLADQRADFVANELIVTYGVPEEKILIVNGESTNQFGSSYEMNRVAVIHFME